MNDLAGKLSTTINIGHTTRGNTWSLNESENFKYIYLYYSYHINQAGMLEQVTIAKSTELKSKFISLRKVPDFDGCT